MTPKMSARTVEAERAAVLSSDNPYDVLQVRLAAQEAELKAAHRRLSLLFHPDRCKLADAGDLQARVNVAYNTLTDPEKRARHDTINHVEAAKCTACKGSGKAYRQKGFKLRVEVSCAVCAGTGRKAKVA